jgi:hypothetical protein
MIFQPRPNTGGDFYGYTVKYVKAVECEDGVVRNVSFELVTRLPVQITSADATSAAAWLGTFRSSFDNNPAETDALLKTLQLPSSIATT